MKTITLRVTDSELRYLRHRAVDGNTSVPQLCLEHIRGAEPGMPSYEAGFSICEHCGSEVLAADVAHNGHDPACRLYRPNLRPADAFTNTH